MLNNFTLDLYLFSVSTFYINPIFTSPHRSVNTVFGFLNLLRQSNYLEVAVSSLFLTEQNLQNTKFSLNFMEMVRLFINLNVNLCCTAIFNQPWDYFNLLFNLPNYWCFTINVTLCFYLQFC